MRFILSKNVSTQLQLVDTKRHTITATYEDNTCIAKIMPSNAYCVVLPIIRSFHSITNTSKRFPAEALTSLISKNGNSEDEFFSLVSSGVSKSIQVNLTSRDYDQFHKLIKDFTQETVTNFDSHVYTPAYAGDQPSIMKALVHVHGRDVTSYENPFKAYCSLLSQTLLEHAPSIVASNNEKDLTFLVKRLSMVEASSSVDVQEQHEASRKTTYTIKPL